MGAMHTGSVHRRELVGTNEHELGNSMDEQQRQFGQQQQLGQQQQANRYSNEDDNDKNDVFP